MFSLILAAAIAAAASPSPAAPMPDIANARLSPRRCCPHPNGHRRMIASASSMRCAAR